MISCWDIKRGGLGSENAARFGRSTNAWIDSVALQSGNQDLSGSQIAMTMRMHLMLLNDQLTKKIEFSGERFAGVAQPTIERTMADVC
jgi:hypothetical protein